MSPQVSGAGRGLVAAQALRQGQLVHEERPYLCVPSHAHVAAVCHHCLGTKQQPGQQQHAAEGTASSLPHDARFCSQECHAAAQASYMRAWAECSMQPLSSYCQQRGERFPLMAARLAALQLQAAGSAEPAGSSHAGTTSSSASGSINASAGSSGSGNIGRSDSSGSSDGSSGGRPRASPLLGELSFLCFANVPPPPPEPWRAAHALLMEGAPSFLWGKTHGEAGQHALSIRCPKSAVPWHANAGGLAPHRPAARTPTNPLLCCAGVQPLLEGCGGSWCTPGARQRMAAVADALTIDWFVQVWPAHLMTWPPGQRVAAPPRDAHPTPGCLAARSLVPPLPCAATGHEPAAHQLLQGGGHPAL